MSEASIQAIMRSLNSLNEKLDAHITKSDGLHADTTKVLGEIKPILENIQAAKKIGGWLGWIFNSKLGWAILVALAGIYGVKQ
jgi:hypothetical protein